VVLAAGVAVLLAGAGCTARPEAPAAGGPAPTGSVAAAPATTAPASPSAPAGTQVAASIAVRDRNRYTYNVAFSVTVGGALSVNTTDAKPGQANVTWAPISDGNLTVTNTTSGHTLPIPDWLSLVCAADASRCLSLYGFWPATSPVCTVKTVDRTGQLGGESGDRGTARRGRRGEARRGVGGGSADLGSGQPDVGW
jgi:hypothetical protein